MSGNTEDQEEVKTIGLAFGSALQSLKQGRKIAREGWNGKGMFVYLNYGSTDVSKETEGRINYDGINSTLFSSGDINSTTRLPNINMQAASGNTVTGWLASQTDMLADDWCIVD